MKKIILFISLSLSLFGCGEFDNDHNYLIKNPFNLKYYNFSSSDFVLFDKNIILYYEKIPNNYILSGSYSFTYSNYNLVFNFDNNTYTFTDLDYPSPDKSDYSSDSNFENAQIMHQRSTMSGDIKVVGSVIYVDFSKNKILIHPNQKETTIPVIVLPYDNDASFRIFENEPFLLNFYFFGNKIFSNNSSEWNFDIFVFEKITS